MLPNLSTTNLQVDFEETVAPSLTWDFEGRPIDGIEAIKQTIYCILHTDRYYWPIFSYDYGSELLELIGQPMDYVQAEAERLIKEALLQDDRITDVVNFAFEPKARSLAIKFEVQTVLGDIMEGVEL